MGVCLGRKKSQAHYYDRQFLYVGIYIFDDLERTWKIPTNVASRQKGLRVAAP